MHLKNHRNQYQIDLDRVFDDIPKAVFAAIACSAYEQIEVKSEDLAARIADEWRCLHLNGIVPNKPTKRIVQVARQCDPFRE
jgi:hypothetical protein